MEATTVMPETGTQGTGSAAFGHTSLSGATASAWLEDLVRSGSLTPGRALIPSAEMVDEATTLVRLGFHVTVVDPDRELIKRLKGVSGTGGGKLVLIDDQLFRTRAPLYGTVSLVVDRTFFPSLDPVRRADWSYAIGRLLHSDGRLLGLFPVGRDQNGPPYAIPAEELRRALERLFVTELLEPAAGTAPGETRGWKGLFRRK